MYVKYCENKPKSEFIVAEFIDFFEVNGTVSFVHDAVMNCSLLLLSVLSSINP